MASSIPVLRVLVREVKATTRRRYGLSSSDNNKSYGTSSMARSNTVVVAGGHKKNPSVHILQTFKSSKSDNRSDTSVLIVEPAEGRILQTQEINVEYHRRDTRFEMDGMV